MERDVGENRWEDIADGIEADGQSQSNHGGSEPRPEYTPAPAARRTQAVGMDAGANHCHVFAVLEVAQEHYKAKEDSHATPNQNNQ